VEVNNSGNTQFFFHRSATIPTQAPYDQPGAWVDTSLAATAFAEDSTPFPVATQWTATTYHMYLANLGQFNLTDTTVTFRITGPDAKKVSDGLATFTRTLYEGVAYELAPPPPVPGDFNSDGVVDAADFAAWQAHFPASTSALLTDGDADGDGDVDGADFVVWQTNFPTAPGGGATPVPEPSACMLAVGALVGFGICWRRHRAY
jgi:hypothetical protein